MTQIEVLTDKNSVSSEEIRHLTKLVGFDLVSIEKWEQFLNGSGLAAYIRESGKLIAFARINHNGERGMVYDMCVDTDFQGRGLGDEIIRSLIDQAESIGLQKLGLDAWAKNASVSDFYKKYGFVHKKIEGFPDNYMELDLSPSDTLDV